MPGPTADLVFSRSAPTRPDPTIVLPTPVAPGLASPADPLPTTPTTMVEIATDLDLAAAPPDNVATLLVTADGEDSYAIQGLHPIGHPRTVIARAGSPLLNLPTAKEVRVYLEQIRGIKPFQDFARWIKKLRDAHGDGLTLVIHEETPSGVPWEMLRMLKSHLGALATTVRWKNIVDEDEESRPLEFARRTCTGSVVACPDAAPAPNKHLTDAQKDELQISVQSVIDRASKRFASLQDWRAHVRTKQEGVGLVYVLCHAIWAGIGNAHLAPLDGSKDRLEYGQLLLDPCLLGGGPSIVFLNACSSAAAIEQDDYLPEAQLLGFAEPFLRRGATAVIGTISRVHVYYATQFARDLLDLAAKNPATPLAVLLRRLRQAALDRLDAAPDDQTAIERWFYTFHYVLYGSPAVALELK